MTSVSTGLTRLLEYSRYYPLTVAEMTVYFNSVTAWCERLTPDTWNFSNLVQTTDAHGDVMVFAACANFAVAADATAFRLRFQS